MSGPNSPRRQSVYRAHGERGYTKLRNDFLQNPQLTHEEIGMGAQMLSRSPDWKHTAAGIAATSPSGMKKVWRVLRSLEEHGYICRVQARTEAGTFGRQDYLISDDPAALRRVAEEIHEIQQASPYTQNGGTAPHRPLRSAVKRSAAEGMQEKKESRNDFSEEKKESLSPGQGPDAAIETDALLDKLFEEFRKAGPFPSQGDWKAARAVFAQLTPEGRQQAIGSAVLYAEEVKKQNLANKREADSNAFATRVHNWFAKDGHKHPDGLAEYVPGLPVKRSYLKLSVDHYISSRDHYRNSEPSWAEILGPRPGAAGCKVPAGMIAETEAKYRRLNEERRIEEKALEKERWNGHLQASMRDSRLFMTRLITFLEGTREWDGRLYGPAPGEPGSLMDEHYSDWIESAREQIAATAKARK